MACMCGDLYCPSCGPAQGNSRCDICGAWSADGGCADPEACAKASREMADAEARQYAEDEKFRKEMEENPELYRPRIFVSCPDCGADFDETEVEHLNIEEGLMGEDILTFICPACGKETKSTRRG